MKAILNWVKSNPIIVLCALVFCFSLGWVVYVSSVGGEFIEKMKKINLMITEIKSIMTQRVQIPPEKPDGLPRFPTITVNQHAIDDLRIAYKKMNDEYENIFKLANQHNQATHIEMIEGIFPDPHAVTSRPFEAKERYRQSFKELVEAYSPTAGYPQIDAKPPMSGAEIAAALDRVEVDYLTGSFLPPKQRSELNDQEVDKLRTMQAKRNIEVLQLYAKSCHIYAQNDPTLPGFPFEIQGWSSDAMARPPTNVEIWDGQMSLWIQQDICRAIALTNKVDTATANVMNSPVKHLYTVTVNPKYIGLAKDDSMSVDHRIPDDFAVSMSGRYCNPLYDVRHVAMSVIIDSERMPEFFNALSQVNFMTVIGMQVSDADEYAALRGGEVWGPVDCVKVDFQIETIWLREWTMKLMPKEKKADLGLPLDKPAKAGAAPAPAAAPK